MPSLHKQSAGKHLHTAQKCSHWCDQNTQLNPSVRFEGSRCQTCAEVGNGASVFVCWAMQTQNTDCLWQHKQHISIAPVLCGLISYVADAGWITDDGRMTGWMDGWKMRLAGEEEMRQRGLIKRWDIRKEGKLTENVNKDDIQASFLVKKLLLTSGGMSKILFLSSWRKYFTSLFWK